MSTVEHGDIEAGNTSRSKMDSNRSIKSEFSEEFIQKCKQDAENYKQQIKKCQDQNYDIDCMFIIPISISSLHKEYLMLSSPPLSLFI